MNDAHKRTIARELESCITNTISRLDKAGTHRPFHEALLSKEALFWSRFERSFSTSFGQRSIEQISKTVALAGGASQAANQKATIVSLSAAQLNSIETHIGLIRGGRLGRSPNWERDLAEVNNGSVGFKDNLRVISDLWWVKDGIDHYMSIKTVKPNIDQTAEAKRDLLKLKLHDPNCRVFYGLYYNPYGEKRSDYNWTPPMGVFDFRRDPVVLIGKDYWDTLGGDGVYEEILGIAEVVGKRTRASLLKLEFEKEGT